MSPHTDPDAPPGFPSEEINELRTSQAQLALQVTSLASEIQRAKRAFNIERISIQKHLQESDEKAVYRTIIFARLRARKALLSTSAELGKSLTSTCASNSVVQTILKSSPADCTLLDFQTLSSKLLTDNSVQCAAYPSEYHIQFPNFGQCSRLSIIFDSYADLCQALEMDVTTREAAVYREKKNRIRTTTSVQVLGVNLVTPPARRILLACNAPSRTSNTKIHYLHQASTSWFEGTWECGLKVRSESASSIHQLVNNPNSSLPLSDNGSSHDGKYLFAITWERIDSSMGSCPENIAGSMRSYFPAVVLRTQLLTTSAKESFSHRTNDFCLKKILSTPQN